MKKPLFDGEEVLKTWDDCTLTNKRVWRYIENDGQSEYRGFPLSQFQGATIGKTSHPWLLYFGGAVCLFALAMCFRDQHNAILGAIPFFLLGGALLIAWHFTKKAQVFFCSGEVKISIQLHANEQDFADAVNFISEVEMAATSSRPRSASAA